jgi:hypothetical protein
MKCKDLGKIIYFNLQDLTCDLYANNIIRGPELGLLIIQITVLKWPQFEPIRTDEA